MNPILINEKNFNRFSKRLQKLIAEKTNNQYAPGLMESKELLSQVFGVQSLHEMKKMLELIAESEKTLISPRQKVPPVNLVESKSEKEPFDSITPDDPFNPVSATTPRKFKGSTLNAQEQAETLLEKMEKESLELEQWMQAQKKYSYDPDYGQALMKETVFIQEQHQAYGNPSHGIKINNPLEKTRLKELYQHLDFNNTRDNWKKNGYVLGCFLQAVKGDEIVDISMPFDWIPVDNSQANWNDDLSDDVYRPLTSDDLKKVINHYKEYLQDNNIQNVQIEVRAFYKTFDHETQPEVFQIIQMVSDKKKALKLR